MKKYLVYVDGSSSTEEFVFKAYIPAKNEKEVREYVAGNGEVISIKDISSDFFISSEKVSEALNRANFGRAEHDLIIRCLERCEIAN